MERTWSGSAISAVSAMPRPHASFRVSSSSDCDRDVSPTDQPAFARPSPIPRPIPRPAPVTSAIINAQLALPELRHHAGKAPLHLQAGLGPMELGDHGFAHLILRLAFANQLRDALALLLYVVAIGLKAGFVGHRAVTGDDGVEI